MDGRRENGRERNMHDGIQPSPTSTTRSARSAFASVALGAAGAMLVAAILSGDGFSARRAEAAPPPSALNMQQDRDAENQIQALDPGQQRLAMIAEIRALRDEVRELRTLVTSGRMKTEVTNLDRIRLEIDYARLREAIRSEK